MGSAEVEAVLILILADAAPYPSAPETPIPRYLALVVSTRGKAEKEKKMGFKISSGKPLYHLLRYRRWTYSTFAVPEGI